MKVIADINISVNVVAGLRSLGHDAERADVFVAPTATDAEIAQLAARLSAIVLTRDQDFSALLAMSKASAPSLINLRHSSVDPQFLVGLVDQVLKRHELELKGGAIVTIDERGARVHRLPIGTIG